METLLPFVATLFIGYCWYKLAKNKRIAAFKASYPSQQSTAPNVENYDFIAFLISIDACPEGVDTIGTKTYQEAWETCQDGYLLEWLLIKLQYAYSDKKAGIMSQQEWLNFMFGKRVFLAERKKNIFSFNKRIDLERQFAYFVRSVVSRPALPL